MDNFAEYLAQIDNPQQRSRMAEVLAWVARKFSNLETKIAWNQPMFTDHGTFIIGFSTARHNLAIAPEVAAVEHFADDILKAGYSHTKGLVRIPWDLPVDWSLLEKIIEFNIREKADYTTFWRK